MWLSNSVVVLRVSRWSIDKFAKTLALGNYRLDADLLSKKKSAMGVLVEKPQFEGQVRQPNSA